MEWSTWKIVSLALILYWILCRSLRWRLATQIANKFKGRDPYSLSVAEAQWVVQQIFQLEMCYLSRFATAFALFRTYGIGSISQILLKTSQLLDIKNGARRYADSGVLISDFTTYPFDSDRHARALARMNYLHSHYNISNDDKLYTLSVFVTSPQRWLEKYEWRPLTELEIAAWWILWREIGFQMKIENIPRTYPEIRDWADEYEKRTMLPNETNHELAEVTTGLLLYFTPNIMKGFAKNILVAFMDDRLRKAMIYPPSPQFYHEFINKLFTIRGFLLRNFHLPRIKRIRLSQKEKNKFGRYNVNFSDNVPWYLPPDKVGFLQRLKNNLSGIPNPSSEFRMEGYLYEEVGPVRFEGKGKEAMDEEIKELLARGKLLKETGSSGGCPMAALS